MSIAEEMKQHLTKDILPFWEGLKDEEMGGFYGFVGPDLKVDRKAVKGCILNSRILWFFSNAAMALQDDSILHVYNQAFAVYALSSYYAASGDASALKRAWELFDVIESKGFDEGGYKEALDRAFQPAENDKLSENGVMADRTMNTLLHVFEAYTELLRVTNDDRVRQKLLWILDTFQNKIYNPELHRQEVFFDNEMKSLIDLHSYGHDIETSWLLDRGLAAVGDEELTARWRPIIADLVQEVYRKAYDNHSLSNECERGVVDRKRVWWVQAEAVVGFYNQYQNAPEHTEYREAAEDIWNFIRAYVVDKRAGSEWFMHVSDKGEPEMDKPIVEPWKCPYHNGRMCMEIMRRAARPEQEKR